MMEKETRQTVNDLAEDDGKCNETEAPRGTSRPVIPKKREFITVIYDGTWFIGKVARVDFSEEDPTLVKFMRWRKGQLKWV